MKQLIDHIACLCGIDESGRLRVSGSAMNEMETLRDAWLLIDDGRIADYGTGPAPAIAPDDLRLNAKGGWVLPAFCDSHTHLVYADSREGEFLDKINGLSYEEIARRGGGILNSADRLHKAGEEELFRQALERIREIADKGTGLVEIKSGYGLTTADELKILRVIRRLRLEGPIAVRATFLGAHAVGRAFTGNQAGYVDYVCKDMLPAVAREGLADFCDVFCDHGFFTSEESRRILREAARFGMKPKLHADELALSGGTRVAVEVGATSVDHLEQIGDEEIRLLRESKVIPTLLPGASFFSNLPYSPARRMIDAGLPLALASDYNPGSSPSGDMRMVIALACIKMRLTPTEALWATTLNGAAALGLSADYGSITRGKRATLTITRPLPSLAFIPYAYTTPWIMDKIHDPIPCR